jgi:prolyl-tRNA editing enzyme YbaK/EbsC (Cys-tRNA(Pro) deacylase)
MPVDPSVLQSMADRGVVYEEMACEPDFADTAEFCRAYGIPLERSANAILVASRKPEGHNAVCVVLANTRLDVNGVVRKKLGVRKVSFAPPDLTRELTGQEIGGVTIFGLPPEIPVWVDSRVLDNDWIVVGAGTRTAKLRLDPSQLDGLEGFEIVDDLASLPVA